MEMRAPTPPPEAAAGASGGDDEEQNDDDDGLGESFAHIMRIAYDNNDGFNAS